MSLVVSITSVQPVGPSVRVTFNLTPSGSYVTGGDTVDFTKATQDPAFVGMAAAIPSSQAPTSLDIWDAGGNITDPPVPVLGTTQANSKLKFLTSLGTELAAGAYPAVITAGKLMGEAVFPKMI